MTNYTQVNCIHDTLEHINKVQNHLNVFATELIRRGSVHDASKLAEPELSVFTECTQRLSGLTYGSEEYAESLKDMSVALDHHYANNSHHPEHYKEGVLGMDLMDIVEMFADWRAAVERHDDGNILKSITINEKRFGLGYQLSTIFFNTAIRSALQKTKIIAGFPGVGKSYATENFEYGEVLDLESSDFGWIHHEDGTKSRNPDFAKEYTEELLYRLSTGKYKYIFISTHNETLNDIGKRIGYHNINILAPKAGDDIVKNDFLERYRKRGNTADFIDNVFYKNWDNFLADLKELTYNGVNLYELEVGQTVLDFINGTIK